MCCDGSMFARVVLQEGERLPRGSLRVKRRGGETFFPQPCAAHADCACRVYNWRPQRCSKFECRQLRLWMRGEVDFDSAADAIRGLLALRDRVGECLAVLGETRSHKALAMRCDAALRDGDPAAVQRLRATWCEYEIRLREDFLEGSSHSDEETC